MGQWLGYLGVAYSSPTMGSAMSNISPAFTFFLAVLFRYLPYLFLFTHPFLLPTCFTSILPSVNSPPYLIN